MCWEMSQAEQKILNALFLSPLILQAFFPYEVQVFVSDKIGKMAGYVNAVIITYEKN